MPPTSDGRRRYFNDQLKHIYRQHALPVYHPPDKPPHNDAPNAVDLSTYASHATAKAQWTHLTHVPPTNANNTRISADLRVLLGLPDLNADDASESESDSPDVEVEVGEKRKRVPFKRTAPLDGNLRTFKVRMWPNAVQRQELKRTFSAARRAYNWALDRVKNHNEKPNAIALRNAFRKEAPPPWASGAQAVNSDLLAGAVKDVANAYASNRAKQKKQPNLRFDVRFRSHKKTYTEVVHVQKDRCGKKLSTLLKFAPSPYTGSRPECLVFFGNNLKATGGIRLQDSHTWVIDKMVADGNRLAEDAKIQYDKRTKAFYFIYTVVQPKLADPDPSFASKRTVALDPGVAAFQTYYSMTTGAHGELLKGFRNEVEERVVELDKLQSRITKRCQGGFSRCTRAHSTPAKPRTRRQYRRTTQRLQHKLARDRRRHVGWTQSAHYDAANFLLAHNDVIVNPKLEVQRLSMRDGRVLSSKVARAMLTMSHYSFDQRLKWASSRYAGRHIIDTTGEPGTSKTCCHCGHWKADLGGNKTYECARCGIRLDRDVNGAIGNGFAAYGKAVGVGPN